MKGCIKRSADVSAEISRNVAAHPKRADGLPCPLRQDGFANAGTGSWASVGCRCEECHASRDLRRRLLCAVSLLVMPQTTPL